MRPRVTSRDVCLEAYETSSKCRSTGAATGGQYSSSTASGSSRCLRTTVPSASESTRATLGQSRQPSPRSISSAEHGVTTSSTTRRATAAATRAISARIKLASNTCSDRSRRLEKRQGGGSTSPIRKKHARRQTSYRKPPVRNQHSSRSPSIERPRRDSQGLPADDTTELGDSICVESPFERSRSPHTHAPENGTLDEDSRLDQDISPENDDDQSVADADDADKTDNTDNTDKTDNSISTPQEAEADSRSLNLLKNDKHYEPIMRLLLQEKGSYRLLKNDAAEAKARSVQAEAALCTTTSQVHEALELDSAPIQAMLEHMKADVTTRRQHHRAYLAHLSREMKKIERFATLGVASASRDLAAFEASNNSCQDEINQLELRCASIGECIAKMEVVVKEMEASKENGVRADKVLLEGGSMRKMARGHIGRPSGKLSIGVLESLFEDAEDH